MDLTRRFGKSIAFILMLSSILRSQPLAHSAQTQSLVDGNTGFALDLYHQLRTNEGNLFFSPYSISACLAMAYAGARGDTAKQIAQVFRFDENQQQLHSSFGALQRQLGEASREKGIELSIANALWAQKDYAFLPAFLEIAKADYQANLKQADFRSEAEAARSEINDWVAQKTRNKIQKILPPGSLDAATRLVLANAIYFKGLWAKPYDKTETSSQPFFLSTTRQVDVPLMHHVDEVRYAQNNDFQAVELPYKSNELSMMILLPRQVDGCVRLENLLTTALLSQTVGQMKQQKVEIFLPRFKLESTLNLIEVLARMGLPDAFGARADFSGMDGSKNLYISGVFHKAWGEVNEEGTEAAAATALTMTLSAIRAPAAPPPIFRADRPFIFLLRHVRSGSLLFLGRFANPSS